MTPADDLARAVANLGPLARLMGKRIPEWKRKALAWEIQGVVERARAAGMDVPQVYARIADAVEPEIQR